MYIPYIASELGKIPPHSPLDSPFSFPSASKALAGEMKGSGDRSFELIPIILTGCLKRRNLEWK